LPVSSLFRFSILHLAPYVCSLGGAST
jgi:hypothetical protein